MQQDLATPLPADEGEIAGEAAPDPSLPTTGSRGRGQPRSLVQLAGGGVARRRKFRTGPGGFCSRASADERGKGQTGGKNKNKWKRKQGRRMLGKTEKKKKRRGSGEKRKREGRSREECEEETGEGNENEETGEGRNECSQEGAE